MNTTLKGLNSSHSRRSNGENKTTERPSLQNEREVDILAPGRAGHIYLLLDSRPDYQAANWNLQSAMPVKVEKKQ
jgi:hypothetical protein